MNTLKSDDSALFIELQSKTEQFVVQLDKANSEIATLKQERNQLNEQKNQFEFVLEEKTREISTLKADLQTNVQHIAAQGKAIEKLQDDLKHKAQSESQSDPDNDELGELKTRYNELYSYLEKKNEVLYHQLNFN